MLLAGDVYDGDWKDYNTGLFFAHEMSKLRRADVRVFIVSGNHDAASQLTKNVSLPSNVHVFPTERPGTALIDDLSVAIHGQGFARREVREDLSVGYPAPLSGHLNIGLLHTSAGGREGHENYAPCRVESLVAKGYDYWALGHVHQREVAKCRQGSPLKILTNSQLQPSPPTTGTRPRSGPEAPTQSSADLDFPPIGASTSFVR